MQPVASVLTSDSSCKGGCWGGLGCLLYIHWAIPDTESLSNPCRRYGNRLWMPGPNLTQHGAGGVEVGGVGAAVGRLS